MITPLMLIRRALPVTIGLAVLLSACTSTTAGDGRPVAAISASGTSGSAPSGTSASSPSGSSGSVDVADLAAKLQQGTGSLTSASGVLDVQSGPITEHARYQQRFDAGQVSAMDMTMQVNANAQRVDMHLIEVDGKSYVHSPQIPSSDGKKWLIASETSENPQVAQLAKSLQSAMSQTTAEQYARLVAVATDVAVVGTETVSGAKISHYHLVIDVAKAAQTASPDQAASLQAALAAGVKELPLDLWVDDAYVVRRVNEDLSFAGTHVVVRFTVDQINQPMTITAPPPDQISSD